LEYRGEITEKLESIDEVAEVYLMCGIYDYIVELYGNDKEEIDYIVRSKLHRIEGVFSTLTHYVLDEEDSFVREEEE